LYLSIKRVSIARVMFLATAIMAITSGMSPSGVAATAWTAFIDPATLELAGAVLAIGVFSTFMKEFSFLGRTVSGLSLFLGNVKAAIMSVPALIGSMPVVGGAALSAPLVDRLGEPLGLGPDVKAAANLAFRHGMFFIFPFSPGVILTSKITGIPIGTLISRLWPMSVAIWGIGYFALLWRVKPAPAASDATVSRASMGPGASQSAATAVPVPTEAGRSRASGLAEFLTYGGPLVAALFLGLVVKWPLWLSLAAGTLIAITLALFQRKPMPALKTLLRGANLTQVAAMFWIMSFKSFVTASPVFPSLIAKASQRGVSPALMGLLIPFAFGFGSASQTATVGVLMPLLAPASLPATMRLYQTCLIYVSSFTAYFFSPLHMCQVLTCEYFKIDIPRVYKRNWPILAGFIVIMGALYFIVSGLS
jgi:hypothetical protein